VGSGDAKLPGVRPADAKRPGVRPAEAKRPGVRLAEAADLNAIIAIAIATGQDEDWDEVYPAYISHVMKFGSLLVAERRGAVIGFGATMRIGTGSQGICMLSDLFVDPAAHGTGVGRTLLGALWAGQERRMTFSSLHANALPLYTNFGVDAWWPLLYLRGDVSWLAMPSGWSVSSADPAHVSALERRWTGIDRVTDHQFWAGWPGGTAVVASLEGGPAAAGSVGGAGAEFGVCHLATIPEADHNLAGEAVIAVLSWLEPADGLARVCLPAPHPATRALLAAGWRVEEFDLHMASEFGLIDARRAVPSSSLA
jgi:GNAT superfamily N-acetyltransferase